MRDRVYRGTAVPRKAKLLLPFLLTVLFAILIPSSYAIEPMPRANTRLLEVLANYEVSRARELIEPRAAPTLANSEPGELFPPLKMPIPAGSGYIPADGGYNNGYLHLNGTYDKYALDICAESSCARLGRHAIAPTDIRYVYSSPYSIGYHFFEIYDDGFERLCLSLGHFNWSAEAYPWGAPEPGTFFPRGAVLGELSWWGQIPHVHIGIWTMASVTPYGYPTKCHYLFLPREPQPFTGIYQLDGQDFPECWPGTYDCYNVHAGRKIESTNVPFSYYPIDLEALGLKKITPVDAGSRFTRNKAGDAVTIFK